MELYWRFVEEATHALPSRGRKQAEVTMTMIPAETFSPEYKGHLVRADGQLDALCEAIYRGGPGETCTADGGIVQPSSGGGRQSQERVPGDVGSRTPRSAALSPCWGSTSPTRRLFGGRGIAWRVRCGRWS